MRERLIELLRDTFNNTKGVCIDFDEAVEINADYLLANGVIVPPCKVGDKIYRCCDGKIYEWEVVCVAMYLDETNYIDDSGNEFTDYDIGKSVFLTKEDAENALKGSEE